MTQRGYGRDLSLTIRMSITMLMLAMLYVVFFGFLAAIGIPIVFMAIIGAGMLLFQYFVSDKLVLAATGAKVVTAEQEPRLHGTIERLAAIADMPKPKYIAVMETHVPNAFATGRNPSNAVIAVTRGLMTRLNERELEAVLGHELAHVKNRDVMVLTWASLIVVVSGFLMQMLLWSSLFVGIGGGFGGNRRDSGSGAQVMIAIICLIVVTAIVYFISQMLILILSRYREYAADRGGAIITGAPLQLASALQKISNDMYRIPEKDLRQVEHASAFFIIPALKGNTIATLFSSHPPVEKRIERLQDMQRNIERSGTRFRA